MARGRAYLALIAGAAMLGSHWLAYALAAPGGHARAHLLDTTGHGYWPLAATFGIVALVVGLASFIAARAAPRATSSPGRTRLFVTSFLALLVLQVGGFTALELIERALAGHSVGLQSLFEPAIVIGFVVQIVAALVAAVVLMAIAAAVDLIVHRLRRHLIAATPLHELVSLIAAPRLLPATGAASLRGPPRLPL